MKKKSLRQEYRLFLLRARACKAYDEGNTALAHRISREIDDYQQRLWIARERRMRLDA